ncbi:MAG: SBBP repeat-containing protein, partial [Bacteroidetes bacterium]|nr:SBBP repeat-containing protein [Bacteroidota bacterium]
MKITLPTNRSTANLFLIASLAFSIATSAAFAQETASATPDISSILKYYNKQIYFTQNAGQFSTPVLYRADFPVGQAVATEHGMIISTFDPATMNARQEEGEQIEEDIKNGKPWRALSSHLKGHTWMMNFQNSSSEMSVEAKDVHTDVNNYMNSGGQHSNVNSYAEVWYNNVYNHIDVRYYPSQEASLEYDIICKPGFDKNKIAIRFDGIETMSVAENGHLVMHTSVGDVDFPAPVVYQKINGVQKSITANFVVTNNNVLSFNLGEYDALQALVIDPIALRWATWVNTNSSGDNHGHCIWVDPSDGAIYMVARVVGTTDQITPGAFDISANGNLEMIIGKYTEPATIGLSGTRVWQTYVGGGGDDNPYAMEQGPDGNLYITGYTSSTDFPLIGGTAFNGGGASIDNRAQTTDNFFILKINKLGNSIKSSVIGGNGDDGGFDLRINESGDIVICGNTKSTNLLTLFPGTGASNTNNGDIDACVFKINADLSTVAWMKNYGGSLIDQPTIMVQDISSGDLFVGGYTTSTNFPVTGNARQSAAAGTQSGFIQKLNSSGATRWSSYFQSASSKSTSILCMEFNTLKTQLYFGGITGGLEASNISGGLYTTYGGGTNDFFVCRMDTDQHFVASTYLGGSGNEVNMMGLNTDLNNDVYVFGYTNSTNFPVSALPNTPLQTTNLGSNDKVFLKINSTLSTLNFSTYYGGSADDYDPVGERGIKFSNCRIYTIVTSKSNNIPLTVGGPNVTRVSTTPYEPGLVVWANPPDLAGNTINDDQTICYGAVPADLIGSVPSYVLPTISRNGVNSAYPSLGSAATYQWQSSINNGGLWTNISGATNKNLLGTDIGQVFVKTIFRRIIGGDACILPNAADQTVIVTIISVTASNITNVSCKGGSNGSITASTDGTNPTYLWSNGATTQTISGLTAGSYSVTVTSNSGCSTSGTFTVTEPNSLPSVSITPVNPTCVGGGSNGSACANASGGTGVFTYLWSNGATTQCATGLSANTYSVTATDANGCPANNSTTLTLPSSPTTSISGTLSFCSGSSTQLCATGGFASYAWSTGATTQCITVSTATTVSVTVTDANGCSGSAQATSIVNPVPTALCSSTPAICGTANGTASVNASGGTGTLTYSWSNGGSNSSITGLAAGPYSVTVSDANQCSASCSTTVASQGSTVSVIIDQVNQPSCNNGGLDGSMCANVTGATGVVTYVWSPSGSTQCITGLGDGTYSVMVTDGNGCTASSQATTIARPVCCQVTDPGSIGYDESHCGPFTPSTIVSVADPSGGLGTIQYVWLYNYVNVPNNGNNGWVLIPGATNSSYSPGPITQTTYYLRCSRRSGCSTYSGESNIVSKIVNPVPMAQCSSTPAICGTANGTASVNASGGTGTLTYSWSNGGSNSSITGLAAGPYSV